ncbi:MAG TPA: tetratricopeptide repeat protein [Bacteroidales bacterium]|nr:tetratricopeptide repeat protein [Bacteroidales bacterium]HPS17917.1 tetratricopeptide repeat protein [Bacteroidales bacterium]
MSKTKSSNIKKNIPPKKTQQEKKKPVKNIYFLLLITVLVFCLYAPSIKYDFTNNDDVALVKENYDFLSNPSNFTNIFKQSVFYNTFKVTDNYYRPVLTLSFFIDTQIAGKHYWFIHFANIILHLICCILLFYFFQKLSFDKIKAFIFSSIFAVHPVLVQTIAWIPGRNDTLLTLFALCSFIFLIDYLDSKKILLLFLHLFFFLISILTKESAIFLPVIFGFYILLWKKEKLSLSKKINEYKTPVIFWVILVIFTILLRKTVLKNTVGYPLAFIISNFFTNLPAIIQYIGKIILPFHLNTMPVLQDVPIIYGIISVLIIILLIWKTKEKNYKRIIFGILWLLILLAPAILRTSDKIETLFLEHRLYLPMIGFMIILMETDFIKKLDFNKIKVRLTYIAILIFFFVIAWMHSKDYKNELSYWTSAAEGSPHSSAALRGMASYLQVNKQVDRAEKLYYECLKLNPDIAEVNNNLGRIYLNRGDDKVAEKFFLKEIEINPNSAMAYYNLGCVRYDEKNYTKAIELIKKSLTMDDKNNDAKNDLAALLALQENYEESVKLCISILESDPTYKNAKQNLKSILTGWQDKEKAEYYKNMAAQKGITY